MKAWLSISLIGNGLLVVALLYVARRPGGHEPILPGAMANEASAPAETVVEPSPARGLKDSNSEPFLWSRIESTDYRTYLANLRGVGCPEQTIRDIITADVHGLYARRCEEFRRKNSLVPLSSRPSADQQLAAEFRQLDSEERSLITTLLGAEPLIGDTSAMPSPSEAEAASPSIERARRAVMPDPAPSVSMPIAWKDVEQAALSPSEEELGSVSEVRQLFKQRMDEGNQDPSDPSYLANWQNAQRMADDRLAAELGQPRYDELKSLGTRPSVATSAR